MKSVKIPPDIGTYHERIFLNLTARQAFALGLGAVVIWAIYAKVPASKDVKDTLLMIVVPFFFALGWVRLQGLPLERWIPILVGYLVLPQQRPWQPDDEEVV